jgi:hypothetical protein
MRHALVTPCAASVLVGGLIVLASAGAPSAQRRNRADNASLGVPVATSTIRKTPDTFFGTQVTVSAGVDQVLSKTAFLIDQRKAVGATTVAPAGTPLLVIAPRLIGTIEPNEYLLVRGQIVPFDRDAIAGAAAGYTLDLPPDVAAAFTGQPVLVALSVIDSRYTELAAPGPVQAPAAPAAAAR